MNTSDAVTWGLLFGLGPVLAYAPAPPWLRSSLRRGTRWLDTHVHPDPTGGTVRPSRAVDRVRPPAGPDRPLPACELWPPGHKVNADDVRRLGEVEAAARYGDRAGTGAVNVTIEQAAALQTFPVGYPWQGSRSARFRQVGDAIPPVLAWHILRAAIPVDNSPEGLLP